MRPVPKVSMLDVAFGADATKILPPMAEIPAEFKTDTNPLVELVNTWFFLGLKDVKAVPKPGVDRQTALDAVTACITSFDVPHEHKKAGCAFLLAEWFESFTGAPARGPGAKS